MASKVKRKEESLLVSESLKTRPELLPPAETAKVIGVAGPNVLAVWRCEGRGPSYVRVGTKIMYDMADIVAWLDSRKVHHCEAVAV